MEHETIPPPARHKPRRTNADYRWTVPKVQAFLAALAQSGRVADAARAVGMSRQAAYKLRARLDGPRFRAAFEGARKTGIRARAEASRARLRSRWDGPGLAALDYLRQGDTRAAQGDTSAPQGDGSPAQGDAISRKATQFRARRQNNPLDSVTTGPCLARNLSPGTPPGGAG